MKVNHLLNKQINISLKVLLILLIVLTVKFIVKAYAENVNLKKIEPQLDYHNILKGHVQHSEKLDPLAKQFNIGQKFDKENLIRKVKVGENWFWIPKWRSGTFKRESQVDFTATGQIRYKSEVESVWGYQLDSHGEVWQYVYYPSSGSVRTDDYEEVKLYQLIKPLEINVNLVQLYFRCINLDVSDKTKKIIKSTIQEDIETYTPVNPGKILCRSSSAYYRADGVYTNIVEGYSEENLIKPVTVIREFNGIDIVKSFHQFLMAKGWDYLIPH